MSLTLGGRRREPGNRLAALACAGLVLAGCAGQASQQARGDVDGHTVPPAEEPASEPADDVDDGTTDPPPDVAAPEPRPVAVEIPAIGVAADLVSVGLNDDGSMEVPAFGLAGWYAKGPRPGAVGPSVIVAHYDSTDGPDVFYELAALEPGDRIHVHRQDGSTATFVVEGLERHPKEALPGERIWATSSQARLTLITCGGVFDRATGHYTDNVIAYAAAA